MYNYRLLLPLLFILSLGTCVRAQTAPPNDDIANATVVSILPFTEDVAVADASLATDDSALLDCEDGIHSFWYSLTPTTTGLYRVASGVDGATEVLPVNDLTLGLFTANADFTVTATLECEQDDRVDGGGEVFFATLDAGVTYYVRVALVEATTGDEVITTTVEYVEEITFTGAQNTFWENPDNWSPARVPTAGDRVIIPESAARQCNIGNFSGIAYAAEARMIEIENKYVALRSDATLTLADGETGIRVEGVSGTLLVDGQLTVRDMTGDGISLTDGNVFFEEDGEVLIENIGDDGLQSTDGGINVRKPLTIRNVADNGMVVDGGQVLFLEEHSIVIEDITDHGITVFNDGELYAQGELTIQRVGKDGITTPGGRLEISSTGVVNIETAGDFGIGDADFVNDGYLRIDDAVEDGIDTDFECANNGEIYISNTGDDGIDIQDDSTFVNNGYLEVDNASDEAIGGGDFINAAAGELVFNGSLRSETIYANGSRLSVGPGVASGSFFTDPVLDSVTLVADIEGGLFTGGNDDFWTVGDFDLADSKLELRGSYVPAIGETFDIISASQGNILGTFEGLPEGSILTFNGVEMQLTYLGGNVNAQKVTLTAISEPAFTWTGAEDSDWGNTNNWDFGVVPGTADSVYIPFTANDPVVNTGFATVGSILVDGATLTVASGTILNVKDQATGLTIINDGVVNVNGPLTISGQQSKGLAVDEGEVTISESTRLTVDNSFAELSSGDITINGELFIFEAIENGLNIGTDGTVRVQETGTLQIIDAAGDGLFNGNASSFFQSGTTTIADCGGDGIHVTADNTFTIRETGVVNISGCAENGISMADASSFIIEAGGSVTVTNTVSNGLELAGSVQIDGSLTFDSCEGNAVLQNTTDDFVIGETGIVSITNNVGTALDRSGVNGRIVNEGTLVFAENAGFVAGDFNPVENGSQAIMRGEGTLLTTVTFAAGGSLFPGTSPGCLTFSAFSVDLSEAVVNLDIEGTTACEDYDQLICEAGIKVTDAVLNLDGGYTPAIGEAFTIVKIDGGALVTGTFAGLAEGATVAFNGVLLEITYQGGNGDDVVLTAIQNTDEATWSGAVSSDWFDSGNWENGVVPFTDAVVTIPEGVPNQPVIGSGEVTIAGLIVEEGNTFTLAEGAGLTVDGGTTGLLLLGDSINIAGELLVDNVVNGGTGIRLAGGGLYVMPSGDVRLDSLGIVDFLATTVSVAGSLEVSNTPNTGVALVNAASIFTVVAGGSVTITEAAGNGLTLAGNVQIDGMLTIDGSQSDAILQLSEEDFIIGTTGVVSTTNNVGVGVTRAGRFGRIVNDGTLVLTNNNSQNLSTDYNTVENGPQSVLRSDGTIRGEVVFAAGGQLFPGASPGCLTFGNEPADLSGAIINLEIEGTTACDDYDQITLGFGGDLTDAVLSLSGSYFPEVGEVFSIVKDENTAPLSSTFAGLPDGSTVTFNGVLLEITYPVAAGDDVVLTAVSAVLPLDLLSFTGEARDKTNLLTWTTANEEDFSHFELERSSNGRGSWSVLTDNQGPLSVLTQSDLEASGIKTYTSTDHSPLPTAYYRLKMIDLDGTFSYSEVILLENNSGAGAGAMRVFPNPSNGRFTVDLSEAGLPADGRGALRLVDLHGRQIWSRRVSGDRAIELSHPSTGVYLLTLVTDDGYALTRRIVIR